jgi:hypothetical protein
MPVDKPEANKEIMRAYETGMLLTHSLPARLREVRAIAEPDKYIFIAPNKDSFIDFLRETIAISYIEEEVERNITEDLLKMLGDDEDSVKNAIFESIHSREHRKYLKKANIYIRDNFSGGADAREVIGGVYNNSTGFICLNPIFEGREDMNQFDFYLWTLVHELAHAIHFECYAAADSSLNHFLGLYWLSKFLPDRVFLKGMDASAARALILKSLVDAQRDAAPPVQKNLETVKFRRTTPTVNFADIHRIMDIRMNDQPPTRYSDFSPSELWAESFALFTTANKDAKLLMPNMHGFICDEILKEEK